MTLESNAFTTAGLPVTPSWLAVPSFLGYIRPVTRGAGLRKEQAMGLEITVIDDSDYVGYAAAMVREDEIYMVDVPSMVANVVARLRIYSRVCTPVVNYNKISRLNILDHGDKDGIEIGNDVITVGTLPHYEASLRQLRGRFEQGGFVHVQHCEAGQNRSLLIALARTFGANVYA